MVKEDRVFIYGVPGVGKTYFSKMLGKDLKLPVIEGDRVRNVACKGRSKQQYPFLYYGTCKAYVEFGTLNETNVMRGLLAVRHALSPYVFDELKKYEVYIIEAAFLDPSALKEYGKVILLTMSDEKKHYKQFLSHREKLLDIYKNEFYAARLVQQYLIEEASRLGIEVIDRAMRK